MVMVNEQHQSCWQYPAWNLPNSNHVTTHLEPIHHTNHLLSSFNSHVFTANAVSQGISALVPGSPYSRTNQSTGKKFLIFDHSGDQTRLFFSPPQNELLSRTTFGDHGKLTGVIEHESLKKLIIQEQLDRNYSERPEDTEEIDALLYSDVDGEDDDDDDEVTSTGHSPFPVQGGFNEHAQFRDIASSDGSSKRQRLNDGGYMKSSLKDTASSVQPRRSHRYDDDVTESSCVKGTQFKGQEQSPHLHAREKKAKIREMLKILGTMIPGLKSKDPLSVFDEAIDYLKLLRLKAKEDEEKWADLDYVLPRNDYF